MAQGEAGRRPEQRADLHGDRRSPRLSVGSYAVGGDVPLEDERDDGIYRERPRRGGGLGGRLLLASAAVLIVLLAVGWYLLARQSTAPTPGEVPLVTAPEGEIRVQPESPGGLQVPYQDNLLLNPRLNEESQRAERLLPGAAAPKPLPPAPQAEKPAPQATAPTSQPSAANSTGGAQVPAAAAPATAPKPAAPAAATPPTPAQTKPAASSPAPTAPTTVTPGPVAIQLGAYSSEQLARRAWDQLQQKFSGELKGLKPLLEPVTTADGKTLYRLQGTGLPDVEAAQARCAALKAQSQGCIVRP